MLVFCVVTVLSFILQNNVLALESDLSPKLYSIDEAPEMFEKFIEEHHKKYDVEEKEERFKIFVDNLKTINSLNEKSSNAVYGINDFSDLTLEEFRRFHTGFKEDLSRNTKHDNTDFVPTNFTAPDEFDWRSKGVVSSVKDQGGDCGSCWAFSASGNVESINAIKTGRIIDVSEQQLVDCDNDSLGCNGGHSSNALNYFVKNGAMSLSSYPYVAQQNDCKYDSGKVVIKLKSYKQVFDLTEDQIKHYLYNIGPLSINLAGDVVKAYTSGIIQGDDCFTYKVVDHAVLLVGYGSENGVKYWTFKNSWGVRKGEKGYFRIERGVNCLYFTNTGITTAVI